jgi:hypothetical protein
VFVFRCVCVCVCVCVCMYVCVTYVIKYVFVCCGHVFFSLSSVSGPNGLIHAQRFPRSSSVQMSAVTNNEQIE